ncbi:MAG: cobamide remodeling phosphodiesterase CbiR [Litorilinea sp.]
MLTYPFRLGTTSYVTPGELTDNARYLAELLRTAAGALTPALTPVDMQLVLFDMPDGPSNLPDAATVAELAAIGQAAGLSYTVHLLADLEAVPHGERDWPDSWRAAHDVITRTRPLAPLAYVGHLDGRALRSRGYADLRTWAAGMADALRCVVFSQPAPVPLAIENLEGYPPDLVEWPVRQARTRRCVDVGHLWLDGHDPLPHLHAAHAPAVIHLHGVGHDPARARLVDHQALDVTPAAQLDPVCRWLVESHFTGVVTLEVFGPDDFARSLAAFRAAMQRVTAAPEC